MEVAGFDAGQSAFDLAVVEERGDEEPGSGCSRVLVGCRDGQIQSWSTRSAADPLFEIEASRHSRAADGKEGKITALKLFSYAAEIYMALGWESGTVQVARCGDLMPLSGREFLPGKTLEENVGASLIEEMWCTANSAADEEDRLVASLFDDNLGVSRSDAVNIIEIVARSGDGVSHFIWQAETMSELKSNSLNTGEADVAGAFRLPDGVWLILSGTRFMFFVQKDLVQTRMEPVSVAPLWEQDAGYRPITSMAQSESNPSHFATCDDRGEITVWSLKCRAHEFDILDKITSHQVEDPTAFLPTSLTFTIVTSGHTEAATKVGRVMVVAASSASAELRSYALREPRPDDDDSAMEVDSEAQLQLQPKLQQRSCRGPIKSISAMGNQHLVCMHVNGGVSVWSNKGIELRWMPSEGRSSPCLADVAVYPGPDGGKEDSCLLLLMAAAGAGGKDVIRAFSVFYSACSGSTSSHGEAVNTVALVRDGTACCSAGKDATFRMWDVEAATEAASRRHHFSPIVAVRSVGRGEISASLSTDGRLVVWHNYVARGKQRLNHGGSEERPALMAAEMASDDRLLIATVSNRDVLRLFLVPVVAATECREMRVSAARCVLVKRFEVEVAAVTMAKQGAGGSTGKEASPICIELLAREQRAAIRGPPPSVIAEDADVETRYLTLEMDVAALEAEFERDSATTVPEPTATAASCSLAQFNEIRKCGLNGREGGRGSGWTTAAISWRGGVRTATADTNGDISIWDGSGGECAVAAAHAGGVSVLRAAGGGRGGEELLLSGGSDGAVRVWRASVGRGGVTRVEQVAEFVGSGMPIVSIGEVHYTGNSLRFLVGDSAGEVYILKGHYPITQLV